MTSSTSLKQTPLFESHLHLGAKLTAFAGWNMPVFYRQGIVAEHMHVRERCGIFDVSHMGRIEVTGNGSLDFLENLCMNLVRKLEIGFGQYNAFLNVHGGIIDDVFVYKTGTSNYLICANASNHQKVFHLLQSAAPPQVTIRNMEELPIQISIQGPMSTTFLRNCIHVPDLEYTGICPTGDNGFLARTGYTGEVGYELYLGEKVGMQIWQALLNQGVEPIGLGARDTLRLEVCYPLHGQDIGPEITPLEAGLKWACKLEEKDFVGSTSLKSKSVERQSIGIEMLDSAIARQGMHVYFKGSICGEVTSGSKLPFLNRACAMAIVQKSSGPVPGDEVEVDVRGKRKLARVVKKPFFQPRVKDKNL